MDEPTPVVLTQLVLWPDASRIQAWPELVAAIPPDRVLPSPTDFGRSYSTERMTDDRHAAAEKLTRNLAGLELRGGRLVLRGIGLLDRIEKGYRLSDIGRSLRSSYRKAPRGAGWSTTLASALLEREPRTRAFMKLLSTEGAQLRFEGRAWFAGNASGMEVSVPDAEPWFPFGSGPRSMRTLLEEEPAWCLGHWRTSPLLADATGVKLVGQRSDAFTLHRVHSAIRAAMEVFLQVGLVESSGNRAWVRGDRAAGLFGALAQDFGWDGTELAAAGTNGSLEQLLLMLLPGLRLDTGYVVASELRDALREHGVASPDRELFALEQAGKLEVTASDYGQSRHGTGLYDDPRKQLIKLRLSAEETRA
ncbi:MAG: hypothetical protein RLP09_30640 [Sandaracinaceae bacterium]